MHINDSVHISCVAVLKFIFYAQLGYMLTVCQRLGNDALKKGLFISPTVAHYRKDGPRSRVHTDSITTDVRERS